MESYKNSYKIIRIGSYPTKEQHGRGRHNIELSRVYTAGTLFITWNTRETLMHELSDLDVKCFRFTIDPFEVAYQYLQSTIK